MRGIGQIGKTDDGHRLSLDVARVSLLKSVEVAPVGVVIDTAQTTIGARGRIFLTEGLLRSTLPGGRRCWGSMI